MKLYSMLMFIVFGCTGIAEANEEESKKATQALIEITSRCAVTERQVSFLGAINTYRRMSWSGGCMDGMLHGTGTLVYDTFNSNPNFRSRNEYTGVMVRGKMIGPWLIGPTGVLVGETVKPGWSTGFYQWSDALVPGFYKKEADGSYSHHEIGVTLGAPGPSLRPVPGTPRVTAEQAEALLKAALGAPGSAPSPTPVFKSKLLTDLMPQGQVRKAASNDIPAIKTKSIAIILASDAENELKKFDSFQAAMRQEITKQTNPKVRGAMEKLVMTADKKHLMLALSDLLLASFKQVVVMNDLVDFKRSQHDYALVFDVQASLDATGLVETISRLAANRITEQELQKYFSTTASLFILDRDLAVVFGQSGGLRPSIPYSPNTSGMRAEDFLAFTYDSFTSQVGFQNSAQILPGSKRGDIPIFRSIGGYLSSQRNAS